MQFILRYRSGRIIIIIYKKISRPEPEVILCQLQSEFPHILPLLCSLCISVTSECRHGDWWQRHAVTVIRPYIIVVIWLLN